MWIRPTSNSSNVRVMSSKETYGDGGFELIYVAGTGIYLRGAGSAETIVYSDGNNTTFPTELWTHYTAVLDGTAGRIYRNGEAMNASGSIVASSFAWNANLSLGGYNGSDDTGNYSGALDEFRLYNGVPSADWLKAEYQAMADANFLTTEAIPSTVVVTNATSSRTESRITVEGTVQLGDNDSQVTVVIGVGADPNALAFDRECDRIRRKADAGADFIITQPVFDPDVLFRFMDAVADTKLPVIAGVWPLTSFRNAQFMHDEVPGVVVPDSIMHRMASSSDRDSQRTQGIAIARDTVAVIRKRVSGVQISAPFGNVSFALEVLK